VNDWTITVVDTLRVKGKRRNSFPAAEQLVKVGVPLKVARRWKRTRYDMTVGLRRRVRQDTN
jgi:hypothetical protein